jgi:hypothetical protein
MRYRDWRNNCDPLITIDSCRSGRTSDVRWYNAEDPIDGSELVPRGGEERPPSVRMTERPQRTLSLRPVIAELAADLLMDAGELDKIRDLLWERKAEKPAGYPNADLYQLLAYCTILGLPVGHLVYARGNASPARHVVRQSGVQILCHAIDLSQPPEQLIGQMSSLGELVATMAVTSCRYPV